jgi:hypothetical protein
MKTLPIPGVTDTISNKHTRSRTSRERDWPTKKKKSLASIVRAEQRVCKKALFGGLRSSHSEKVLRPALHKHEFLI